MTFNEMKIILSRFRFSMHHTLLSPRLGRSGAGKKLGKGRQHSDFLFTQRAEENEAKRDTNQYFCLGFFGFFLSW
jgi:hypothetical protein